MNIDTYQKVDYTEFNTDRPKDDITITLGEELTVALTLTLGIATFLHYFNIFTFHSCHYWALFFFMVIICSFINWIKTR